MNLSCREFEKGILQVASPEFYEVTDCAFLLWLGPR